MKLKHSLQSVISYQQQQYWSMCFQVTLIIFMNEKNRLSGRWGIILKTQHDQLSDVLLFSKASLY